MNSKRSTKPNSVDARYDEDELENQATVCVLSNSGVNNIKYLLHCSKKPNRSARSSINANNLTNITIGLIIVERHFTMPCMRRLVSNAGGKDEPPTKTSINFSSHAESCLTSRESNLIEREIVRGAIIDTILHPSEPSIVEEDGVAKFRKNVPSLFPGGEDAGRRGSML